MLIFIIEQGPTSIKIFYFIVNPNEVYIFFNFFKFQIKFINKLFILNIIHAKKFE